MPNNKLGQARRSQCIGNLGPGAIAEFRVTTRDGSAAVSIVASGLEQWDRFAQPAGLRNDQVTYERRLQAWLGVSGFRLPPVDPDAERKEKAGQPVAHLTGVRFPRWLQCPECQRIGPADAWTAAATPGDPTRRCAECTEKLGRSVYVAPVRFVVACTAGHLQEFPWHAWVRHKPDCPRRERGLSLRLVQAGKAGLAGLRLECPFCKESRPLEGAFGKDTLRNMNIPCDGRRHWIGPSGDEKCLAPEAPRAVQRGASNLHFPLVASALAIPPFTEAIQLRLDEHWADLMDFPREEWPAFIRYRNLEEDLGLSTAEIIAQIDRAREALTATGPKRLRLEEYEKLSADVPLDPQVDFELRPETPPTLLAPFFDRIVRVVRLREVRALRGFTRIHPPAGESEQVSPLIAKLSLQPRNWLPAIEVRGEGIFLRCRRQALEDWEKNPLHQEELAGRADRIHAAWRRVWEERHGEGIPAPRRITPRFLLVHSFAHAFMRQLTLTCGYSSAALRERLYADDELGMAGLLVYTATADSDGSLGGLERQGKPDRLLEVILPALRAAAWCSNDPLCIEDVATFSDPQNLAACHSCLMAPETSCEEFNVLLDRATLVGRPGLPSLGFFQPLLDPTSDL